MEPNWIRFVAGALASSTAEVITLPIDCTKVRLQSQGMGTPSAGTIQYSGMIDAVRKISRHEGPSALWNGLTPAIMRQAFYSSLCMVLYEPVRAAIAPGDENDITFLQKLSAGGLAGAFSISFANPLDVMKVRMQADRSGKLYSGVADAILKIHKVEGIRGFSKGLWPNIQRGFIVNAAELGTYDHSKSYLIRSGLCPNGGILSHFGASFIAGFAGAAASNPVDVIKTRLMSQPSGADALYTGMVDCALKTVRNEGLGALYKGFFPNWMRKGPWCVLFFVSYEQYRLFINE